MHHQTYRNDRYVHHDEDEDAEFSDDLNDEEGSDREDLPHDDSPNTASAQRNVSYFENSSNFEVTGGDFSAISGDVYVGSPPSSSSHNAIPRRPAPVPKQSSSVSYFQNTKNFKITNGNFQAIAGNRYDYSSGSQTSSSGPLRGNHPSEGISTFSWMCIVKLSILKGLRPKMHSNYDSPSSPSPPRSAAGGHGVTSRTQGRAPGAPDHGLRNGFATGRGTHILSVLWCGTVFNNLNRSSTTCVAEWFPIFPNNDSKQWIAAPNISWTHTTLSVTKNACPRDVQGSKWWV